MNGRGGLDTMRNVPRRAAVITVAAALALSACGEMRADVSFDSGGTGGDELVHPIRTGSPEQSPATSPDAREPEATPPVVASSHVSPGPAAPPDPPPTVPADPDQPRELGEGEDAQIGRPYRYQLLTHCGIEHTWWNGAWWNADPPQTHRGSPPPGWGDPFQDGVMVQVSAGRLEFTGDQGQRADFVPRPDAQGAPPPCD